MPLPAIHLRLGYEEASQFGWEITIADGEASALDTAQCLLGLTVVLQCQGSIGTEAGEATYRVRTVLASKMIDTLFEASSDHSGCMDRHGALCL